MPAAKTPAPGQKAKADKPAAAKANAAKKAVLKGTQGAGNLRKVRTSVSFHRPKTLRLPRAPKYPRKSAPHAPRLDKFQVVLYPLNSETSMRKVEEENTLVFIVARQANKRQIALAFEGLYGVKPARVNTLIRPDGKKKAFLRLDPSQDALDVASKVGLI